MANIMLRRSVTTNGCMMSSAIEILVSLNTGIELTSTTAAFIPKED